MIKINIELNNITFNTVLLNWINNTQMNKNIDILKSQCINFISVISFCSKTKFALLVYPKLKDEIHETIYENL